MRRFSTLAVGRAHHRRHGSHGQRAGQGLGAILPHGHVMLGAELGEANPFSTVASSLQQGRRSPRRPTMSQSTPALRAVPSFVQGACLGCRACRHSVGPVRSVRLDRLRELGERDGVAPIPQQLVGGATTTHSGHIDRSRPITRAGPPVSRGPAWRLERCSDPHGARLSRRLPRSGEQPTDTSVRGYGGSATPLGSALAPICWLDDAIRPRYDWGRRPPPVGRRHQRSRGYRRYARPYLRQAPMVWVRPTCRSTRWARAPGRDGCEWPARDNGVGEIAPDLPGSGRSRPRHRGAGGIFGAARSVDDFDDGARVRAHGRPRALDGWPRRRRVRRAGLIASNAWCSSAPFRVFPTPSVPRVRRVGLRVGRPVADVVVGAGSPPEGRRVAPPGRFIGTRLGSELSRMSPELLSLVADEMGRLVLPWRVEGAVDAAIAVVRALTVDEARPARRSTRSWPGHRRGAPTTAASRSLIDDVEAAHPRWSSCTTICRAPVALGGSRAVRRADRMTAAHAPLLVILTLHRIAGGPP